MSDNQYVLWFILMAVGIGLILGLGTAQMAGLFRRQRSDSGTEAEVHHWYDRFHIHRHHHAA